MNKMQCRLPVGVVSAGGASSSGHSAHRPSHPAAQSTHHARGPDRTDEEQPGGTVGTL